MSDDEPDAGKNDYARIPLSGTGGCDRFFIEHARLSHFVGFVSQLAMRSDEVVKIASRALAGLGKDEEPPDFDNSKGAVATLRRQRQLLLQMTLTRGVDNYLTYLAELLALLFESKPETMRAKLGEAAKRRDAQPEFVSLDVVLQHKTMDDLLDYLAERRVNELSHRGMLALDAYLSQKLGFPLFNDEASRRRAVRIVEVRNVIVHNRAAVNRLFIGRVSDDSFTLGQTIEFNVDDVFGDLDALAQSVADIDARAVEKWTLPATKFEKRPLLSDH